jgi:hypothetical protein
MVLKRPEPGVLTPVTLSVPNVCSVAAALFEPTVRLERIVTVFPEVLKMFEEYTAALLANAAVLDAATIASLCPAALLANTAAFDAKNAAFEVDRGAYSAVRLLPPTDTLPPTASDPVPAIDTATLDAAVPKIT